MAMGWIRAAVVAAIVWAASNERAAAQQLQYPFYPSYVLNQYYYYPFQVHPYNYWPVMGPRWPEQPGQPYLKPPAYQAFPPFREPGWRYEYWQPQRYHRGHHFWLDQF